MGRVCKDLLSLGLKPQAIVLCPSGTEFPVSLVGLQVSDLSHSNALRAELARINPIVTELGHKSSNSEKLKKSKIKIEIKIKIKICSFP